jgi:diguanylate cyclase (GGDEF)-like protein
MVPYEFLLLYGVLVLVLVLGFGWLKGVAAHSVAAPQKNSVPQKETAQSLTGLKGLLAEIGTSIDTHGEKVCSFGEVLFTVGETDSVPTHIEKLEEALNEVREENKKFVRVTLSNVLKLPQSSALLEDELKEFQSRLMEHLSGSEELGLFLEYSKNVEAVIRERDVLLNSIETLLESKKATEATLAVTQKRLAEQEIELEEAKYLAGHDELTHLPNRRLFKQQLSKIHSQFTTYGQPFSYILVDFDNFKDLNDKYGQSVGDAVLTIFGRIAFETSGRSKNLFRLRGDQFAILLSSGTMQQAKQLADRLQERSENVSVRSADCDVTFTLSIGIAEILEGESCAEFQTRVEMALKSSKHSGGDQICVDEAQSELPAAVACE